MLIHYWIVTAASSTESFGNLFPVVSNPSNVFQWTISFICSTCKSNSLLSKKFPHNSIDKEHTIPWTLWSYWRNWSERYDIQQAGIILLFEGCALVPSVHPATIPSQRVSMAPIHSQAVTQQFYTEMIPSTSMKKRSGYWIEREDGVLEEIQDSITEYVRRHFFWTFFELFLNSHLRTYSVFFRPPCSFKNLFLLALYSLLLQQLWTKLWVCLINVFQFYKIDIPAHKAIDTIEKRKETVTVNVFLSLYPESVSFSTGAWFS